MHSQYVDTQYYSYGIVYSLCLLPMLSYVDGMRLLSFYESGQLRIGCCCFSLLFLWILGVMLLLLLTLLFSRLVAVFFLLFFPLTPLTIFSIPVA